MGYDIIFHMNMSEIRDKLFAKIEKLEDPKSIFKDEIFADLNAKIREINPSERAEFGKNLNELRGEISRKIVEIENVKKEDRKYVIKEAEIVVSNYIKRIEDNLADRKIDRLKKSYKKTKKLNVFLAMTTIISILLAIFI
jgi:phenylalanyl-tRNA synthetase alpha subunit